MFEVNRKLHILLTGGAGFIGSHLADAFLNEGHRVTIVDDLSTGRIENLNKGAVFHRCDISQGNGLDEVFHSEPFDVLCHHAAQMNVRHSVADPVHDAMVNVMGFLHLLQRCISHGVRKVIFASTGGAIYGEQQTFPASEEHPTNPISPYGVAKLSSEKYLSYYHAVQGIHATVLRYSNVYGPRQNSGGEAGVVAIFGSTLLRGGRAVINGDGRQTRDFVFVDDVVRANLLSLSGEGFQVYNVGTGVETSIRTVFDHVRSAVGSSMEAGYAPPPPGEQQRSVLDVRKIDRSLGWRPMIGFDEGIVRTVGWLRTETIHHAPS